MRGRSLALLPLALVACSTSQNVGPGFERFSMEAIPGPDAYPVVGGVVLLDRGALRFFADPERRVPLARLRRSQRLLVLRPEVLALRRIEVTLDPGSSVTGLIGQAITPDGETVSLGEPTEKIQHDGRKALVLAVPALPAGSVVEHAYDTYFRDPRFVPPWYFQSRLPTRRSEFAVAVPLGFEIDYRFLEGGSPNSSRAPERFETEEGTRLSWSLAEVPPVFDEPEMSAFERDAPQVHVNFAGATIIGRRFSGFASWEDVQKWFLEERAGNWSRLSPGQIGEAQRIAHDAPLEERALKLTEVVARDLPWPKGPRPPLWRAEAPIAENVLLLKQGNGTSRGMLLAALLRACGIDAYLAFAADRKDALLLPDFPVVRHIDRLVAVVPRESGPLILDPSSFTVSAEVPSPALLQTRVVALLRDGPEILNMPTALAEDSRATLTYDFKADPTGHAVGQVEGRLTGAHAGALRALLLSAPPERYPELVAAYFVRLGGAAPIDHVTIADLAELRRPLVIRGSAALEGLLKDQGGGRAQLDLRKLAGPGGPALLARRRYPLMLGAPSMSELAITVMFPDDHRLESVPEPLAQNFKAGSQELLVRIETAHRLGVRQRINVTAAELSAADHPSLARLKDAAGRLLSNPITVSRPPPKTYQY